MSITIAPPGRTETRQLAPSWPQLPGTQIAGAYLVGATEGIDFGTLTPRDAPSDSECVLTRSLGLLMRIHEGEVWVVWPELDEYGVGPGVEEAKTDLWRSLCSYLEALEQDEQLLSQSLTQELALLRGVMRHR